MESSSSSKVTVEYFDPSGVFPLISPGLLSRLPLRNLHWKSPSRPLRSISSLHIDLVPADPPQPTLGSSAVTSDELTRVKSHDSTHSGSDNLARTQSRSQNRSDRKTTPEAGTLKGPVKERRHQIPGLRQTPYLKVFLLRCDDADTYKCDARRLLREWIKEHTPPSQSSSSHNKQENHDAFEWMIVHVVLPNTAAAAQPGASGSSAGGATATDRTSGSASRWPGRGSSTILDKIRSDFNGSSKNSTDRVAQIRLHTSDILPHLLPEYGVTLAPSQPGSQAFAQEDQDTAWLDLVVKLKSLILTSFDSRVRQYEEDIQEKDGQRALPGWNFCTFFVLKEGLARGFESVGLVEDALTGYDELAMGLDDIVRAQAARGEDEDLGASFLAFTEDLRRQAEGARLALKRAGAGDDDTSADDSETEPDELPLSPSKKQYRDLILSNNISVFDFRCYVFTRQMSLLLRLGNAHSSRAELMAKLKAHPSLEQHESSSASADDSENLLTLAEVCNRGADFITAVARVMRKDLQEAYRERLRRGNGNEKAEACSGSTPRLAEDPEEHLEIENVIDNLVNSWIYSVSQQLLAETATRALPIPPSSIAEMNPSGAKEMMHGNQGHEPKVVIPEPKTMMHPARVSSMPPGHHLSAADSGPAHHGAEGGPRPYSMAVTPKQDKFLKNGIEELASSRADLYQLSRSIIQHLGEKREWLKGHSPFTEETEEPDVEEIDLNEDESSTPAERSPENGSRQSPFDPRGLNNKLLATAVKKKTDFYNLYEILTDKMLRHYTVANRTKSVQKTMSDLAALKFHLKDYATAASYFGRLIPFYGEMGWDTIEASMLAAYATCLKHLNRKEEYVMAVLELLGKAATEERRAILRRNHSKTSATASRDWLSDDRTTSLGKHLPDLLDYAKDISHEVVVPVSKVFGDVEVSPYPRHHTEKDGFSLQVALRYLLRESIVIQSVKIRIVGVLHGHSREIWLASRDDLTMKRGLVEFSVETNMVMPGSFTVSKIVMEAQNIFFVQEGNLASTTALPSASTPTATEIKQPRILCYPRPESFEARLGISQHMNLDVVRSLEISLMTGWNEVLKGELRLRSASAGLRLRTADATVAHGGVTISKGTRPGVIEFSKLAAGEAVKIDVPYGLERDTPELLIKIEVAYSTPKGDFLYSTIENVSIVLPLGVNVQEVFKQKALFSKFTVSTASSIPLRVLSSKLEGLDSYRIRCGGPEAAQLLVFPKQPASLIYQVIPRRPSAGARIEKRLTLSIDYRCLDEEISDAVEAALDTALETSPHRSVSRLLRSTLLSRTFDTLDADDYEAVGMSGDVRIPPFATMGWTDMLQYIPATEREPLLSWLGSWHDEHRVLHLPTKLDHSSNRTIVIPVELPQVQVVQTAELHLPSSKTRGDDVDRLALVGQVIPAELRIHHTRAWDHSQSGATGKPLDFVYEIQCDVDHWLIGGQKRVAFSAKENEIHSFPIMLLPLRSGHLLLPQVEVHPVMTGHRRTGGGISGNYESGLSPRPSHRPSSSLTNPVSVESLPPSPEKQDNISCETDYRNQGQTILAIPDLKGATISLEPGTTGGTARLVDAERRSTHTVDP